MKPIPTLNALPVDVLFVATVMHSQVSYLDTACENSDNAFPFYYRIAYFFPSFLLLFNLLHQPTYPIKRFVIKGCQ
jgi:hypothetical protein